MICANSSLPKIDDYEQQTLKLAMWSDDLGWNDTLLAHGELAFGKVEGEAEDDRGNVVDGFTLAEFIRVPMTERLVEVELTKAKGKGMVKSMSKGVTTMLRSEEKNKKEQARAIYLGGASQSQDII